MASIYIQTTNLSSNLYRLDELIDTVRNETNIVSQVDDWFGGFKEFTAKRYAVDWINQTMTDEQFSTYLKNYLFTQKGAKFRRNFKFEDTLECRSAVTPPISVIMEELYRNLAIAMVCVFITTFILIANLFACILVLLCVVLTLVCVNGTMHFWGLTIDTVSCINLVLAIGLCVDYAAHVAHTFMIKTGTRNERAAATISSIGPAVFHGGFSTFLAFIFLANSDSHVFITFFKIFVLVVAYGLFHGLLFFPVILSLIGPPPFDLDRPPSLEDKAVTAEELEPQLTHRENSQQVRGMATLKMISIRLKSVKNIQKITQSMKMVSAAKYTKAERELKLARPYGIGSQEFYKKAEVKDEEGEKGQLIIAVSSDRGLCGAVHSSIGRIVKTDIAANPNTKVVIVGDKVRNILQRLYAKNIAMVVTEVGRKPAVFGDAALIAQSIINSGIEFSKGKILFNAFRTVVSFRTTEMPLYSQNAVANASKLPVYDSLDSDVIQSYTEFSLASLLFYSMKENATSEQSSRMTAMDNASKNAGEMIDKLTMTFNRTRQAVITRELIEIISGCATLNVV
uniref:EOG090X0BEK n=1 Tax=Daphnia similis TaxID=35528 RepID=A0A4Y7LP41_9CRUS|nr:EOG090X0BEK [Daphnia similis]SVE71247.1 EOG090X0BEK [Daphnia similis]SVE72505.1 EOG090X0BEK [Daphnia similis]